MMTCAKCGGEIPETSGPGRPRNYCSSACRRAAEYELGRLNRQLGTLEDFRTNLRATIAAGDHTFVIGWGAPAVALKTVESEIAQREGRMRALLSASDK